MDIDGVIRRSHFWAEHADAVFNARRVKVLTKLPGGGRSTGYALAGH